MKKLSYLILFFLFVHTQFYAQQTNIVVAIAKKSTNCNSTDLGYKVYYGDANPYELEKSASNAVKQIVSDWDNVETVDNLDWGKHMGTYMVIISSTTTNSSGCQRSNYGVGFGINGSSALRNAKKHLTGRNWSWNEQKHGFKIVADKKY
jgi:hypothetical protein